MWDLLLFLIFCVVNVFLGWIAIVRGEYKNDLSENKPTEQTFWKRFRKFTKDSFEEFKGREKDIILPTGKFIGRKKEGRDNVMLFFIMLIFSLFGIFLFLFSFFPQKKKVAT
jgi:uncharacterized protein (DUF58 family)